MNKFNNQIRLNVNSAWKIHLTFIVSINTHQSDRTIESNIASLVKTTWRPIIPHQRFLCEQTSHTKHVLQVTYNTCQQTIDAPQSEGPLHTL